MKEVSSRLEAHYSDAEDKTVMLSRQRKSRHGGFSDLVRGIIFALCSLLRIFNPIILVISLADYRFVFATEST